MRAYLYLVFLLFFAVFTSGHVNIVEVPHGYFLNSTKEVVTVFQKDIITEDSVTVAISELLLQSPVSFSNITESCIKEPVMNNSITLLSQFNSGIISKKTSLCRKERRRQKRFVAEGMALGAMGMSAYAIHKASTNAENIEKLGSAISRLETLNIGAITSLQKDETITEINQKFYQIAKYMQEQVLLFLDVIFNPYFMIKEEFPSTVHYKFKNHGSEKPKFYETKIQKCLLNDIIISVKSFYGSDEIELPLTKVEPIGWIHDNYYVEPMLCKEYVKFEDKWHCLNPSQCVHIPDNKGSDKVVCLRNALNYDETCNLNNITSCPMEVKTLTSDFVEWKELEDIFEFVTNVQWKKYPELQNWAKTPHRVERYFNGYGLFYRINGGWGFSFATGNPMECQNMLVKAGTKKMALHDLIIHLLDYVTKQIQAAAMTLIDSSKYHLKDLKEMVGKVIWANLTLEEKHKLMEKVIGIIETSKLKGFTLCIADIPSELVPLLSENQRMDMVRSARTYLVFDCSPTEPEAFVVTKGRECYKFFGKEKPIKCPCMNNQKYVSICHHIIAADLKFPKYKLIERIVSFVKSEKEAQAIKRHADQQDAGKGSASRRSGDRNSRNRKRIISEIRDTSSAFQEDDIMVLDEIIARPASSLSARSHDTPARPPSVINFFPRSSSSSLINVQPRPPPQPKERRVDEHKTESAAVKVAYRIYYRGKREIPTWCNYYPFEIAKLSTLSNYKTRKCVSCNNPLGISKDTVIVIHHETYTFTIANTSTAKQTSGLRGIHARHPCMFSRYPYITEACFYSKLNQDEAQPHLDEIFNH